MNVFTSEAIVITTNNNYFYLIEVLINESFLIVNIETAEKVGHFLLNIWVGFAFCQPSIFAVTEFLWS